MSAELLTLVMFGGLLVGLFMGHPLAFVLGGMAVIGAYLGPGINTLGIIINNVYGNAMDNYVLVAIPLFILMARFLNDSGVTEKMFDAMRLLLANVRGGLALTVVVVSVLLAATTGIVGASIAVMGMIALVPMLKYGYNKELSAGVIMASGCLGILNSAQHYADLDGQLLACVGGCAVCRGADSRPAAGRDVRALRGADLLAETQLRPQGAERGALGSQYQRAAYYAGQVRGAADVADPGRARCSIYRDRHRYGSIRDWCVYRFPAVLDLWRPQALYLLQHADRSG